MDWPSIIAIIAALAILAFANGKDVLAIVRKIMDRFSGGDDARPVPDSLDDADTQAIYHTHLSWLNSIAVHCEMTDDLGGQMLASQLAMHLTEKRFTPKPEEAEVSK